MQELAPAKNKTVPLNGSSRKSKPSIIKFNQDPQKTQYIAYSPCNLYEIIWMISFITKCTSSYQKNSKYIYCDDLATLN
ncbi:hypothetical protein BRADI_5g25345v3 [Brachypodium distachyon]|uniref:Uncharacterized protein n=1 Tax=Brachypodium distachyon TaxID=15368 RepID=A0A2K2CJ86_BRADI|nr:hypothetical protein BRADI_5g25345v3 [Brachypodium distachyon]